MFCESCGNKINETDNFCSKCGNKIIQLTENKKSGKYTLWYLLVGIMILGTFSTIIIPGLAGRGADVNVKSFMALSAWIGIAFAIWAKQKGKSGWLWFFIGFLGVGTILTFAISFLLAFVKS